MVQQDSYQMGLERRGARLGLQWSSVCVGVDNRQGGLKSDLPLGGALDMRAAQFACRFLCVGRSEVQRQLPARVRELIGDKLIARSLFVSSGILRKTNSSSNNM